MAEEQTVKSGFWVWIGAHLTPAWHAWVLVLKPCRVSALMVAVGLAFLVSPQGEDVVRALAEHRTLSGDGNDLQTAFFFAATLAWTLSAWYWARIMLLLEIPGLPERGPLLHRLRTWMPRVFGLVAVLGVALAFHRASLGYAPDEHPDVKQLLQLYSLLCVFGAAAFLAAASARSYVARGLHGALTKAQVGARSRIARGVVDSLHVPKRDEQIYATLAVSQLSGLTLFFLFLALASAVALFALFVAAPQAAPPVVGSAAILLLAASGWIALASVIDFVGMKTKLPFFLGLLVVAVWFSAGNDNHSVRTLPGPQAAARADLKGTLTAWMVRHEPALKKGKGKIPMYLVNAEGGGIRAAYWTVTVLGELQKNDPCFAERLFSLSGVSGGSLGASVFIALLVESRAQAPGAACGDRVAPPFEIKKEAQEILSEDFLSPVVAAMLYPDLLQRVLPWPVARFDRALALEQAWERAWNRRVRGSARMSEPLDRLWEGGGSWTPALFLNATWVETGKRLIASNVKIAAARGTEDFVDTEDALAFFAPRALALSTAAHMSARFTYVSPAGSLVKGDEVHGHVVDGGYFENSGATTTLEILKTIDVLADGDKRWERVEPVVIHISNEPVDPASGPDSLANARNNPQIRPARYLNEGLSPLSSLLNTRSARGAYARETVQWHVGWSHFLHFGLCRRSNNIPLGWVLSKSTRERMEQQLTSKPCTGPAGVVFDNPGNLEKIRAGSFPEDSSTTGPGAL